MNRFLKKKLVADSRSANKIESKIASLYNIKRLWEYAVLQRELEVLRLELDFEDWFSKAKHKNSIILG